MNRLNKTQSAVFEYCMISISEETVFPDNFVEASVVDKHRCHMAAKFAVFVDEDHSKLPTLYWLTPLKVAFYW